MFRETKRESPEVLTVKDGAHALRYRLLLTNAIPDLAPLRILEKRDYPWQDWTASAFVLGASHAMCLARSGTVITELLTCAPPPDSLPAHDLLDIGVPPLGDVIAASCDLSVGIRAQVRLSLHMLSPRTTLRKSYAPEQRLDVDFPSLVPIDGYEAPCTRLGWRPAEHELTWETLHTYPEQGWYVHSETRLQIRTQETEESR